jgi:hypothetical protein
VAQVVEHLSSKCKVLSSSSNTTKKKKSLQTELNNLLKRSYAKIKLVSYQKYKDTSKYAMQKALI